MTADVIYPRHGATDALDYRWWTSPRQRVLILTFDTIEAADAWDQSPNTEGLLIQP